MAEQESVWCYRDRTITQPARSVADETTKEVIRLSQKKTRQMQNSLGSFDITENQQVSIFDSEH